MATEIYMPQLGLTMTDGVVLRWLKSAGQAVNKGEPVVEIETDKVTAEIEAPAAGVIAPGQIAEGTRVPIGGVLGHVLAAGESAPVVAPIDSFQAIINTPQSAVLAVGRIADRPYVVDGKLSVCPTMHLTLSLDHRLVDGAQGALFMGRIVELIENPYLLLA